MRSMLLLWFVGVDIRVIFSSLQTRAQSNTAKHTQNTAQFFFFTLLCSVVLCVCEKYYCVLCVVCCYVACVGHDLRCVSNKNTEDICVFVRVFLCFCVYVVVSLCALCLCATRQMLCICGKYRCYGALCIPLQSCIPN